MTRSFTASTPTPRSGDRTFRVGAEQFHGQGPNSPEHKGGGSARGKSSAKAKAPKLPHSSEVDVGGREDSMPPQMSKPYSEMTEAEKGKLAHDTVEFWAKVPKAETGNVVATLNRSFDGNSLSQSFQYKRGRNGPFEVTVKAKVAETGKTWEGEITIHNIGSSDDGYVLKIPPRRYQGDAKAARKKAISVIHKNLNGILDGPDDPDEYTPKFSQTFRVASEEFHASHNQKDHGNRGGHRSLSSVAGEIRKDWGSKVNYAAKPYLEAMEQLDSINDNFYNDPGKQIVAYFLTNAGSWRGETAKRVKQELKDMVAGKPAKPDVKTKEGARAAARS